MCPYLCLSPPWEWTTRTELLTTSTTAWPHWLLCCSAAVCYSAPWLVFVGSQERRSFDFSHWGIGLYLSSRWDIWLISLLMFNVFVSSSPSASLNFNILQRQKPVVASPESFCHQVLSFPSFSLLLLWTFNSCRLKSTSSHRWLFPV